MALLEATLVVVVGDIVVGVVVKIVVVALIFDTGHIMFSCGQ